MATTKNSTNCDNRGCANLSLVITVSKITVIYESVSVTRFLLLDPVCLRCG